MGVRGRKPTPTHLKLVAGNPGRRPLNPDEPVVARALPEAPPHLCEAAREEWDRVASDMYRVGILTALDRATLAAYCVAYGRWTKAEETLALMAETDRASGGLLIKTSNGNVIQNPLVGTANVSMRDMVKYAAELGITPSARSRIKAEKAPEADPADKYLA